MDQLYTKQHHYTQMILKYNLEIRAHLVAAERGGGKVKKGEEYLRNDDALLNSATRRQKGEARQAGRR